MARGVFTSEVADGRVVCPVLGEEIDLERCLTCARLRDVGEGWSWITCEIQPLPTPDNYFSWW
jgi:hypothetical protein